LVKKIEREFRKIVERINENKRNFVNNNKRLLVEKSIVT